MTDPTTDSGLLHLPTVRWFLSSSALATTGISLMLAVLFKQAFDITDDPLTIGILGLLQFVPAVVLVMVSGYVADRFDRRHVTAWMTMGRVACAVGFFAYSRHVGDVSDGSDAAVWPIYLITLAFGTFDAIAIPARHALAPLVVSRTLLPKLAAAGAVTMVLATIVGPVGAGYLYSMGADVAYLVAAALFAVSVVPLLRVTYAVEPSRLTDRPSLKLALDGLRFIRRSPIVLSAISLDMIAVLFGGAVALIPVIAEERLGVGDVAYGWLRAAPGIGAGVTGLYLARRPVVRRVGPTLLGVVAVFGAFHVVLGVTTSYGVAFVAVLVAAGADMVSMTIRSTLVPLATPGQPARAGDGRRERSSSAPRTSSARSRGGGRPLPRASVGHRRGVVTVLIAGGFAALVPSLRSIDTYADVEVAVDPAASAVQS
ncbi:MAG: MFS transporter [Acidimicrobiales bacterium]